MRRFRCRIGLHDKHDVISHMGRGDEPFLATNDVVAAVAYGVGLDRSRIRTGLRLGQRKGEIDVALDHRHHVGLLQIFAAVVEQLQAGIDRARHVGRAKARIMIGQRLEQDRHVLVAAAEPAILFRIRQTQPSALGHRLIGFGRPAALAIQLSNFFHRQMLFGQSQQALAHQLLFVGETKIVEQRHVVSLQFSCSAFSWWARRPHLQGNPPECHVSSENC